MNILELCIHVNINPIHIQTPFTYLSSYSFISIHHFMTKYSTLITMIHVTYHLYCKVRCKSWCHQHKHTYEWYFLLLSTTQIISISGWFNLLHQFIEIYKYILWYTWGDIYVHIQYVQIYTIYIIHVNSYTDYGGKTLLYILNIKMHNLVKTL